METAGLNGIYDHYPASLDQLNHATIVTDDGIKHDCTFRHAFGDDLYKFFVRVDQDGEKEWADFGIKHNGDIVTFHEGDFPGIEAMDFTIVSVAKTEIV